MKVKITNNSKNPLPSYATPQSAGFDIMADFSQGVSEDLFFGAAYDEIANHVILYSGGRCIIPTNIKTAIPEGYEIQIRARSGLAIKNGITLANSIGTIDSDFRNNWGIILINLGDEPFIINQGDRIAQGILNKVEQVDWVVVNTLDETERGMGGFGHTGVTSKLT